MISEILFRFAINYHANSKPIHNFLFFKKLIILSRKKNAKCKKEKRKKGVQFANGGVSFKFLTLNSH
jgi:hypothetical protein